MGGEPGRWMAADVFLLIYGYGVTICRLIDSDTFEDRFLHRPVKKMERASTTLRDKSTALRSTGRQSTFFALMIFTPAQYILVATCGAYVGAAAFLNSVTVSFCFDIFWFALGLQSVIVDRQIPASDMDGNENEWGVGQIVPVLLLFSIILTFKEIYTGKACPCRNTIDPSLTNFNRAGREASGARCEKRIS